MILFLLQSIGIGCTQGFVLDVVTGLAYVQKGRYWLWTDVAFGPLAAIVTFFGALIVMDGQLHPLLIFGVFLGMAIEHVLVGIWLCRVIRHTRRAVRKMLHSCCAFLRHLTGCLVNRLLNIRLCKSKVPKKDEKS